jgi:hypothetical protein
MEQFEQITVDFWLRYVEGYLWFSLTEYSVQRICMSYWHCKTSHWFRHCGHSGCSVLFLSVLVVGKESILSTKVIRKQNTLKYFYTEYHTLQETWNPLAVSTLNTKLYRKTAHIQLFPLSIPNSTRSLKNLGYFHAQYQTLQETWTTWDVSTLNIKLHKKSEEPGMFLHSIPNSKRNLKIQGCFHAHYQTLQETWTAWDVSTLNTTKLYKKLEQPGMFPHSIPNSTRNLNSLGCFHAQYQTLQETWKTWDDSTLNTKLYKKPAQPGMFPNSMLNCTRNLNKLGCFHTQYQTLKEICRHWTTSTFIIIKQTYIEQLYRVHSTEPIPYARRQLWHRW